MKQNAVCYRVAKDGEYGRFFLQQGKSGDNYWCVLSCVTSYGNYGYHWPSMGSQAASFLQSLSFDYAMGKLMGKELNQYDGGIALAKLKQLVREQRRDNEWTKEKARATWNYIALFVEDGEIPQHELADLINGWVDLYNAGAWELKFERRSPQATGFWRDLWPEFLIDLAADVAEPTTA